MHDIGFRAFVLKNVYRSMVAHRLGKKEFYRRISNKAIEDVAEKIKDTKLARLFIEAQFHAMPQDFCMKTFNRKYPPVSTCFGGQCWVRYKVYIERGIRDAT